jgi:hypothetical protein
MGGGISVYPALAARNAGHGNDRVWKAWNAMKPASHPSHTLWKSLRDFYIPTASTTGYMFSRAPSTRNHRHRKGLVTDVSGPQRNACPGTLTPGRALDAAYPPYVTERFIANALIDEVLNAVAVESPPTRKYRRRTDGIGKSGRPHDRCGTLGFLSSYNQSSEWGKNECAPQVVGRVMHNGIDRRIRRNKGLQAL